MSDDIHLDYLIAQMKPDGPVSPSPTPVPAGSNPPEDLRRKDDPAFEQNVRFCDRCDQECGAGIADKGDHACSLCGAADAPFVYVPFAAARVSTRDEGTDGMLLLQLEGIAERMARTPVQGEDAATVRRAVGVIRGGLLPSCPRGLMEATCDDPGCPECAALGSIESPVPASSGDPEAWKRQVEAAEIAVAAAVRDTVANIVTMLRDDADGCGSDGKFTAEAALRHGADLIQQRFGEEGPSDD